MNIQLWPALIERTVAPGLEGLRSWRWVLCLERWGVSVRRQIRWPEDKTRTWRDVDWWLSFSLHRPAKFGMYHAYYDGPNCCLWLVWLHVYWQGGLISRRCAKCEGND